MIDSLSVIRAIGRRRNLVLRNAIVHISLSAYLLIAGPSYNHLSNLKNGWNLKYYHLLLSQTRFCEYFFSFITANNHISSLPVKLYISDIYLSIISL